MSGAQALATDTGRPVGFTLWFRPGDTAQVERTARELRDIGVRHLRTAVSWNDYLTGTGSAWYAQLLRLLAAEFELLPWFFGVPPELAIAGSAGAPPRRARDYADFLGRFIDEQGQHFEWLQLWGDPGEPFCWDRRLDPTWERFADLAATGADRARRAQKRTALPTLAPPEPNWLRGMAELGAFDQVDAVILAGQPQPREPDWDGLLTTARRTLASHGLHPQLWVSGSAAAARPHDLAAQLRAFVALARTGADRFYWCTRSESAATVGPARCRTGLHGSDGRPVLLQRLLQDGGIPRLRELLARSELRVESGREQRPTLITGGAGFIGCNLAERLLSAGEPVIIYDALARPGTEENLRWLARRHGARVELRLADVRDREALNQSVRHARRVFHFAAQVAVTTSLAEPLEDFEVNGRGTLELLEALRRLDRPPPVLFTSTNKVYGDLPDLELTRRGERWEPRDPDLAARGLDERRPLEFCSPYGCSKGVADQYVLDYARTFGLPAAVFRMSCIYGPRQFGNEDQGWVAHFLIRALRGEAITIYGDGRQVRDILFVDDLVDALLAAEKSIAELRGQAFNIGGGAQNALSLNELVARIERLTGQRPAVRMESWRLADQRWFVADSGRFRRATGWRPRVGLEEGVRRLYDWLGDRYRTGAPAAVSGGGAG